MLLCTVFRVRGPSNYLRGGRRCITSYYIYIYIYKISSFYGHTRTHTRLFSAIYVRFDVINAQFEAKLNVSQCFRTARNTVETTSRIQRLVIIISKRQR